MLFATKSLLAKRPAIDHDQHAAQMARLGKSVRGILCEQCNHLLGRARDSIKILQSAIEYLERPPICFGES